MCIYINTEYWSEYSFKYCRSKFFDNIKNEIGPPTRLQGVLAVHGKNFPDFSLIFLTKKNVFLDENTSKKLFKSRKLTNIFSRKHWNEISDNVINFCSLITLSTVYNLFSGNINYSLVRII